MVDLPQAVLPQATAAPISEAQLREITLAEEREQRFAFARKLALLNGVGLGIGALFVLAAGIADPTSWLLGVLLGALAYAELRGRKLLAIYDRRALTLLGFNQLGLVALVCIYASFRIYAGLSADSPMRQILSDTPELTEALSTFDLTSVDELYRSVITGFYAVLMVVTALLQGSCALYYLSRRKYLLAFLERTPPWVLQWKLSRARGGDR